MKLLLTLATAAAAALLLAATCTTEPVPEPPAPDVDAAPDPDADVIDDCAVAYTRLAPGGVSEDGCYSDTGYPLWVGPTGETFAEVCRRDAKTMGWDIACLTRIETCSEANAAITGEMCARAAPQLIRVAL